MEKRDINQQNKATDPPAGEGYFASLTPGIQQMVLQRREQFKHDGDGANLSDGHPAKG